MLVVGVTTVATQNSGQARPTGSYAYELKGMIIDPYMFSGLPSFRLNINLVFC